MFLLVLSQPITTKKGTDPAKESVPFFLTACFSHLCLYVSVDNDPHFIIYLPKSQRNICFNINSDPGHILNLVSDPSTGKGI